MLNLLILKVIFLVKESLIFWKKMYVCKNKRYAVLHKREKRSCLKNINGARLPEFCKIKTK